MEMAPFSNLRNHFRTFHSLLKWHLLMGAVLFASCSKLDGNAPVTAPEGYKFPGAEKITENEDGTWLLSWTAPPIPEVKYYVFKKEEKEAYDFQKPVVTLKETFFKTEDLRYAPATCFVVRLAIPGSNFDENLKEICTTPRVVTFAGATTARIGEDGKVTLGWDGIPRGKGKFQVFRAERNGTVEADPLLETTNVTAQVGPFAVGIDLCFFVRYLEPGFPASANTSNQTICADENLVTDFIGVDKATSPDTGQVVLDWTPSVHPYISGYNIYQGTDFKNRIFSISGKEKGRTVLTDLPKGKELTFGVRAFTTYGKEDLNGRTIAIAVKDLTEPDFSGVSGISLVEKNKIDVRWNPAGEVAKYRVYLATGPRGSVPVIDWATPHTQVNAPATGILLENLGDDVAYSVGVRAVNRFDVEDRNKETKALSTPDNGAPTFSGLKTAQVEGDKIILRWDQAQGEVTRYRVYSAQGSASSLNFTSTDLPAEPGSATFSLLAGFKSNQIYSFAVRAEDSHGNLDSNVKTVSINVGKQNPPRFLGYTAVTGLDENQLRVVFNRTPDATISFYQVLARIPGSTTAVKTQFSGQPASGTTIDSIISGLQANTTYEILVKPVDVWGNLGDNETVIRGSTLDMTPPLFEGIKSVLQSRGAADVRWGARTTTDIKGFAIYWSETSMIGKSMSLTKPLPAGVFRSDKVGPDESRFTVTGLKKEITYYFKVQAFDESGNEDVNPLEVSLRIANSGPELTADVNLRETYVGVPTALFTLTSVDTDTYDKLEMIEMSSTCPPLSVPVKVDAPQLDGRMKSTIEWTPNKVFLRDNETARTCTVGYRVSDGTVLSPTLFLTFSAVNRAPKNVKATVPERLGGGFSRFENLVCSTSGADDDGDTLTSSFEWRRNGVVIPGATTFELTPAAGNFSPGVVVECQAKVTDSHATVTVLSNPVTFVNEAPTAPVASSSDDASKGILRSGDKFRCDYSASDNDGDPLLFGDVTVEKSTNGTSAWTAANLVAAACTTPSAQRRCFTVTSAELFKYLRCKVNSVTDNLSDALPAFYSTARRVENSNPVLSNATVTPTDNLILGTRLTCNETHTDADNDPLPQPAFAWYRNGVPITGQTAQTYVLTLSDRDMPVSCSVFLPNDADGRGSQAIGPLFSSTVTYKNTPPKVDSVSIVPATAVVKGTILTCTPASSDPDGDTINASGYVYSWTRSGVVIPLAEGKTYAVLASDRSQELKCSVSLAENADGRASLATTPRASANSVIPINQNPIFSGLAIPTVSHASENPRTGTLLTCEAPYSDPDGDALAVPTYLWKRNGALISNVGSTAYYTVQGLDRGAQITCTMSFGFGADGNLSLPVSSYPSSPLVPINSNPTIASVNVDSPTSGNLYVNSELRCLTTVTDPDGDSVQITYEWLRSGSVIAGQSNNRYFATNADRMNTISCRVTLAANADGAGSLASTMTSAGGLLILNRAPTAATAVLNPSSAFKNSDLTCTATATDADKDTLTATYIWKKTDVVIPGITTQTLTPVQGGFIPGDALKCEATLSDGFQSIVATSSAVIIDNNTPSIISSASISPSTAYASAVTPTLSCNATFSDADSDPLNYTYRWQKNGTVFATKTTKDLNAVADGVSWSRQDRIICTAVANDGTGSTSSVSQNLDIDNQPPSGTLLCGGAQTLVINNRFPLQALSAISCNGISDGDGDAPTFRVVSSCTGVNLNTSTGTITGNMPSADCDFVIGAADGVDSNLFAASTATVRFLVPFELKSALTVDENCYVTASLQFVPGQKQCSDITSESTTLVDADGSVVWNAAAAVITSTPSTCTPQATAKRLLNSTGFATLTWNVTAEQTRVHQKTFLAALSAAPPGVPTVAVASEGIQVPPAISAGKAVGCKSELCTGTAASISAGYSHSCAVGTDDNVYCWGANTSGQLGTDPSSYIQTPRLVDLGSGRHAISTSGGGTSSNGFQCAITYDGAGPAPASGAVYCWGANPSGQLGNNSMTSSQIPVDTGLHDMTALSLGQEHACALKNTGQVRCWGKGADGRLGNSSVENSLDPVAPSSGTGLDLGASAIASGARHTCALGTSGNVYCWGYNSNGQLGQGDYISQAAPRQVPNLSGIVSIVAGDNFNCALKSDGKAYCWGEGTLGQLGNGSSLTSPLPVEVSTLTQVSSLAAGSKHACAIQKSGALHCWGDNASGQLGNGESVIGFGKNTPQKVLNITANALAITAGNQHTCVLKSGNELFCFGSNTNRQLGLAATQLSPALRSLPVSGIPSPRNLSCPIVNVQD